MTPSTFKPARKIWLASAVVVLLAAGAMYTRSFGQQQEELDPLKIAPEYQKLVFENAFVRVSEERLPPGKGLPKHRHMRGLTIGMADYKMEQKMYPSGEIVHSNRHVGEINWTDGLIHEARNEGTTNQYVVRVELK